MLDEELVWGGVLAALVGYLPLFVLGEKCGLLCLQRPCYGRLESQY